MTSLAKFVCENFLTPPCSQVTMTNLSGVIRSKSGLETEELFKCHFLQYCCTSQSHVNNRKKVRLNGARGKSDKHGN
jgi:hypothetical protein